MFIINKAATKPSSQPAIPIPAVLDPPTCAAIRHREQDPRALLSSAGGNPARTLPAQTPLRNATQQKMHPERVPGDRHFPLLSVLFLMTPWLTTLLPDHTILSGKLFVDPELTQEDRPESSLQGSSPGFSRGNLHRVSQPGLWLAPGCSHASQLPVWYSGNPSLQTH